MQHSIEYVALLPFDEIHVFSILRKVTSPPSHKLVSPESSTDSGSAWNSTDYWYIQVDSDAFLAPPSPRHGIARETGDRRVGGSSMPAISSCAAVGKPGHSRAAVLVAHRYDLKLVTWLPFIAFGGSISPAKLPLPLMLTVLSRRNLTVPRVGSAGAHCGAGEVRVPCASEDRGDPNE